MTAKINKRPLQDQITEYLEHLEVERNLSPLTIRDYSLYLMRFATWAASYGLKNITELDLHGVKKYRLMLARMTTHTGDILSTRTQAYYIIALRSFLKWLIKMDVVVLPPEKIDLPKIEPPTMRFLGADQVQRLFSQPDISTMQGLRDRAILEVLFSTGLRVSELISLDRDQVDTARREFGVMGKGRKQRVVFLSARSAEWVERYLAARTDSFTPVFIRHAKGIDVTDDGEKMRLSARSVQRSVEKYRRQAALPIKITPHGIRHSFATDLLRNGAGLRDVQELLGHKNLATTQIYTHVTKPELRRVHERFHNSEDNDGSALE